MAKAFVAGFVLSAFTLIPLAATALFLLRPDPSYSGNGMFYGFGVGLLLCVVLAGLFAIRANRQRGTAGSD